MEFNVNYTFRTALAKVNHSLQLNSVLKEANESQNPGFHNEISSGNSNLQAESPVPAHESSHTKVNVTKAGYVETHSAKIV